MFAFTDLFSYSGDEHRSLVLVCKGNKANNLDKDLEKKYDDECRVPVLSRGVHSEGR